MSSSTATLLTRPDRALPVGGSRWWPTSQNQTRKRMASGVLSFRCRSKRRRCTRSLGDLASWIRNTQSSRSCLAALTRSSFRPEISFTASFEKRWRARPEKSDRFVPARSPVRPPACPLLIMFASLANTASVWKEIDPGILDLLTMKVVLRATDTPAGENEAVQEVL